MTRSHSLHAIGLVIANALILASILVFALGFFPYKPFLPGLAEYDDLHLGPPPEAPFDRLVFMVVDALRSDFVYLEGSGFEFTQELIRNGNAFPFTANARSPTVTMPRIKAMTTGSIPSFLDVILNLDESDTTATLASQDTWLAQMKSKAGKLVMYGDDTWLKLFPGTFDRAEGTSSFFVSDFTEVDNNVTRHIDDELRRNDWNTLVLHYLGLDHIGHKSGPRSSYMPAKQREMDGIVQRIFRAMQSEKHLDSTLLVLCGDHGMNDAGNHGASSPGETSPALVFISPKLGRLGRGFESPAPFSEDFQYYTTVEQSDIGPTLAALLGFPVPRNNLGALILDFLPFWSDARDKSRLLMSNARQILGVVTAAFGEFDGTHDDGLCTGGAVDDLQELACDWALIQKHADSDAATIDPWIASTSKWLKKAQDLMSNMASNYDMARIVQGQAIVGTAFLLAFALAWRASHHSLAPLLTVVAPYVAMMFASSYVEEEHQFWYWISSAWLAYLATKHARSSSSGGPYTAVVALALVATRVLRAWNQTGQKFAGEPDIVKTLIVTQPRLFWSLVLATHAWVGRELVRRFSRGVGTVAATALVGPVVAAAFAFKLVFAVEDAPELVVEPLASLARAVDVHSLVLQARIVFYGLGMLAVVAFLLPKNQATTPNLSRASTLHHIVTLLAMTQSRTTNIPLFFLLHLQHHFLLSSSSSSSSTVVDITTSSLIMQHTSFFAFGGTNSIASVDLSNAYNGVSGFSVGAVGVLTFLGNWAGPVWWTVGTNVLLLSHETTLPAPPSSPPSSSSSSSQGEKKEEKRKRENVGTSIFLTHATLLTLFTACAVGATMAACTALRTHLFIWTVFSPKYLYSMAWTLGQHVVVNLVLGGVLYVLG